MRILQVSHVFLPRHSAGVEVYTDGLARALSKRGNDVHLFFSEKVLSRPNYELLSREHHGISSHVLVNNLLYEDFAETFRNGEVEGVFEAVLDEVKPDVVHFQHLMLLSMKLPEIARQRGIPTAMTLHDFWIACPRFGQLLEHGERVCDGPEPEKCSRCMASFKYRQGDVEKKVISAIRLAREVAGLDLAPLVDAWRGSRLAGATQRLSDRKASESQPPQVPENLEAHLTDRAGAAKSLVDHIDLFLSPSETVRDRMIGFGLPEERVELLPYGIRHLSVPEREPRGDRPLVFGFVGTLAPHKGVHVLIDAMRELDGQGRLLIFGRRDYYPGYTASIEAMAKDLPVEFRGSVPREEIGAAYGQIDVLVVPSVWLENSPLVIQEARAAGVPVITSDLGGMKEAVRHDVDGLVFPPGDSAALAKQLQRFLDEPDLVARLLDASPGHVTIEEHVDLVEKTLERLIDPGNRP